MAASQLVKLNVSADAKEANQPRLRIAQAEGIKHATNNQRSSFLFDAVFAHGIVSYAASIDIAPACMLAHHAKI